MDRFDRDILRLLQENSRLTAEKIGEAIGLSPAAAQKRMKRLRESRIIKSEVAVVDSARIMNCMTVIVEVMLERENISVLDAFKKRMRAAPQVQQCYYTTGEADFILILTVQDIHDYEAFTREHFFGNSEIRKFRSNIVMDAVKVSLSLPL